MQPIGLRGWQRLWIVAFVIYLAAVVYTAVSGFPSLKKSIIDKDEITKNLSKKTLEIIAAAKPSDSSPSSKKLMQMVTGAKFLPLDEPKIITFENGDIIKVPAQTYDTDVIYVTKDYWDNVVKITNKKRIYYIVKMIMVFIIPCLVVYALVLYLPKFIKTPKKRRHRRRNSNID